MSVSGKSNFLANKELNKFFRGDAYTPPTSVFIGYTTTVSSASTKGTEPSVGDYARVEMPVDTDTWNESTARQITNEVAVEFPQASASQGTIVGWIMMDALTGGNLLYFGVIDPTKSVGTGDQLTLSIGQLKINSETKTV